MAIAIKMHWVSSSIVALIFVIIGIAGNVLSLIIWSKKTMRSSTGTYLIFQAIADVFVLLFFVLCDSLGQIHPVILGDKTYGEFFAYFGYPFFFLSVIVSIWMLVGVTVDRYLQVCWSHRSQEFCSQRRVYIGAGSIFLLCFIINIPHFKTFQPLDPPKEGRAFTFTEYGGGEGSKHYEFWVHCMFLVLAPWVAVFTFNILILRKVFESNKKTKLGKEKTRRAEAQLTRLLLTVTFTFLFLIIFQCLTQCVYMLKPESVNYRMVDEAFSIAKLGIVINSSINFFLYCLSGRKFRKELKSLCFPQKSHLSLDRTSSLHSTSGTGSTTL
ncbi:FMRFamide receptor-like [Saccostrea echinata]|uniref:FMRFamide receptor-like n=1 Tax=Saccostrea echinata TaxID=191078 RepID=UPI002A80C0CA|nr:FMRFamide receptor-like [Saccostrea echinata]